MRRVPVLGLRVRAWLPAALSAALVVLLALLGGALARDRQGAGWTVERGSVWTERVRRGELIRDVPVQGTLVPERVQWLSASAAARVARIAVRPGAEVEADTVVVVLENAELELAAIEAERQASSAAAALIQLEVRTDAEQRLQDTALVSLRAEREDAERRARAAAELGRAGVMSELDRQSAASKAQGLSERIAAEAVRRRALETGGRRQLAAQRDELARLRAIVAFRRRQLEALQVRAGIRGVVQEIPLENGVWVAAGSALAKIAEPEGLRARVKVAESNAQALQPGLPVRLATGDGALRGRVERVDPAVSRGSVELEVELDPALPAGARADQAVTGTVEIERSRDVVFVARPAGVQDGSTARVFRLDADGDHARPVTARFGRGTPRELEVLAGLAPGDVIVVSDVSAWEDYERVRLLP